MKKITYFLPILLLMSIIAKSQNHSEKPIGIVPDSFKKPYGTIAKATIKKDLEATIADFNENYVPATDNDEVEKMKLEYEKQKKELALLDGTKEVKTNLVVNSLPVGKKIYHKRVMKIVKRKKRSRCNCKCSS